MYSKVMDVKVAGNTKQDVAIEFGKRITSTFNLTVTDTYPADIEILELIFNPSENKATNPYTFNPTTGLVANPLTYSVAYSSKPLKIHHSLDIIYLQIFFWLLKNRRWMLLSI